MAYRGDATIVVDDQSKPRRRQLQDIEVEEGSLSVVRRMRPIKLAPRKREIVERRQMAWLIMWQAEMSLKEIQDATGNQFALSTISEGIQSAKRKGIATLQRRNSRYGL